MAVIARSYIVWLCAGCDDCEPSDGSPRSRYPCRDSPSMDGAEVVRADDFRGAVDALNEAADELDMLGPGVTKASAPWLAGLADRLRTAAGGQ